MPHVIRARVACIGVLGGITIACLWPFHAPANQVSWVSNGNGIRMDRHGSLVSTGAFGQAPSGDKTAGSLEVWIEPATNFAHKTILSFGSSLHPGAPFLVEQNGNALYIQRHNGDPHGACCTAYFGVPNALEAGKPVLLTIVLSDHDTSVYLDGTLAKSSPVFGSSTYNLTGRLVVANSPSVNVSWPGTIFGLAIYDSQLTASEVEQHAREWNGGHAPLFTADKVPVALYMFDEHGGKVAHNQLDSATDLKIPARYFVLHPRFLTPVWDRYRFGWPPWSYWQDVLLNIAGFVPAGLVLVNCLSMARSAKCPALTAVLIGFAMSLSIECLQWFLPTRDSDMTDVMTNTLGTVLGVALYRFRPVRGLLVGLSS
jgi:hypothetical protein